MWSERQFSRAAPVSGSASIGRDFKKADALVNRPHGRFCKVRIAWSGNSWCPLNPRRPEPSSEGASGLEHALDAGVHFLFLDKLTALCRRDSFFDGGKKTRLIVQIADENVLDEAFRISPGLGGHLR